MKHSGHGKAYPEPNPDSVRHFRLYDATANKMVPYRCYKWVRNAHNAALLEVRWDRLDHKYEVLDIARSNKLLGVYWRDGMDIHYEVFDQRGLRHGS